MALSNSWFATLFVIAAVGTRRNRRAESLSSGINHPVFCLLLALLNYLLHQLFVRRAASRRP